ncbi:MAG TPA: CrcB family protein [Marmoricola sp.]|nr:CrcB family protein [Nocardioidaceae bacterium]MCO5323334.1 CrcB family protein [Nocardioidaceae bacterium]HRV69211.1 CrcB family protein [Marmoricola sp.]
MPPPAAVAPKLSWGLWAAAAGGAIGALARWGLTLSIGSALWTTMAINVVGSLALALLPHVGVVRRHSLLPVFLGTGILGGFTTMSGAALLSPGARPLHLMVFVATAVITLPLVRLAGRAVAPTEAADFAEEGGDE